MPSFLDFLSRSKGTYGNAGTDADALRAIDNAQTIRTIAPVTGFQIISQGQLDATTRGLMKRKEQSQRYGQYIQLVHDWRQQDVADTKALAQSLVKEAGQIKEARQAIDEAHIAVEEIKVGVAQSATKLETKRQQSAQKIEELRRQREAVLNRNRWLPQAQPRQVEVEVS